MDQATAQPDRLLDDIAGLVDGARSLPMSASCVVNRSELLGLVEQLRAALPAALRQAGEVLADRGAVVDEGRREAEGLLQQARAERRSLLERTDLLGEAQAEADRVVQEARASAHALRTEVEDYVDSKLATFEIVLTKTLEAVERGRGKLAGRHELDELAGRAAEVEAEGEQPPLP